jgi:septal ring factor EnvC (AmiA/AmiB activator)
MTIQKSSLESVIANIENNISDTSADIREIEKAIAEKNADIEEYQRLSIDLSVRIKKNRSIMLSYLANIYAE